MWKICSNCRGDGTHAKNLGVIDTDEWSDEDLEDYRNGLFDSICEDCKGSGKVKDYHDQHSN
jgi:DnaJ-class molecular chaperone